MDVQHALQARLESVADPESDPETRRLMAQVALAKATSFIAMLRPDGRLLDVTDAPLTSAALRVSADLARARAREPVLEANGATTTAGSAPLPHR